jgi:tripartite-type tricarboxylate transporter receptor subunit TctC
MILTTAGTPKDIVQRVALETQKAVNSPEMKARFDSLGLEGVGSNPQDTAKFLNDEVLKMAKIIKTKNIKPD